ncbi:hypothetical protein VE01_09445 [Pseudogymnoascus verrucosus]|uniref:F-box domain-containing protein n=1 Tax=Pseudogymnoascus verrucosus TaxID=342668 RepID=A0A1B8G9N8_9PEZI|nr:uncharacterized protein VE01_09445 [Pseudogymnoascus verrucosus]OBT92531.1 hypothetical protein VE01_09445 [Pseudogymnoascus verrucosus]
MSIDTPELTRLETLPTEILHAVVDYLPLWDIKDLSCASKRLRQASLSILFRHVKFEFSQAGIEGLKDLLKSNVCEHIASFTYEFTELLKTEILDFDHFRSNILTPDSYVDIAKDKYDAGYEADEFHSYMAIYKTAHDICSEQRSIIDEGADLILSSIFCALPLLQEVRLSFFEVLEDDDCLLTADIIIKEEFYKHHLQVVSSAIQAARSAGVVIHTVSLLYFKLPFFWKEPNLGPLSESLRQLLVNIKVLRVRGVDDRVLELLSHCAFDLHQLDMCRVVAPEKVIKDFFETNKKSIRSIGFHDVEILKSKLPYRKTSLSASMLCRMLDVPQSTPCRAADCGCLLWLKEGWRLGVGEGCSQLSTGTSC